MDVVQTFIVLSLLSSSICDVVNKSSEVPSSTSRISRVTVTSNVPASITTARIPSETSNISLTTTKADYSNVSITTTSKPVNVTKSVCYEHVGCFSNVPPFDNADLVLPKSPKAIGTQFLLYTREGPDGNITSAIDYTDVSALQQTNFSTDRPTKFVIHGFSNSIETDWLYKMKDELLKKEDCNVMIVPWGPGAKFPDYSQAVADTRVVAMQVKMMIDNMVATGTTYKNIHLIGHSLGAHTSGHVGQLLRKQNITLGRITGLDPAEPDYKDHPKVVRLDKLDAHYVDVIHTNGAPFSKGGAGMFEPCGDVDFYVNGGETQPDCPGQISGALSHLGDLFTGHFDSLATVVSCSHSRAHEVFIESINSDTCQFTSYPCDGYGKFQNGDCLSCGEQGCGVLGYDSDYYFATGMLFTNTRRSKPFCGHHYAVKLHVSEKTENTKGKVMVQLNGTWGVSDWLTITRSDSAGIQHSDIMTRVVVAKQIVGKIQSVKVKYVKYKGSFLGWGAGRKNLNLFQINILSGESGRRYVFCLTDPLFTGNIATLTSSDVTKCLDDL